MKHTPAISDVLDDCPNRFRERNNDLFSRPSMTLLFRWPLSRSLFLRDASLSLVLASNRCRPSDGTDPSI
jgi:hypothetical protein